jgi:hypothetical protein
MKIHLRTTLARVCCALLVALIVPPAAAVAQDESARNRNVVLVTMDGLRWQEVFGGAQEKFIDDRAGGVRDVEALRRRYLRETPQARREVLLPFFWSVVARQGQVFGDSSKNAPARLTNGLKFSYPGYSEMLCGFPDPRVDSNNKVPNPNVTVLEWLSHRPGFEGKVAALGTWDVLYSIVNVERSRIPVLAGWDPSRDEPLSDEERAVNALLPDLPRIWPDNAFDVVTQRLSMEYLRKHRPRVFYVMLGETDEWAHLRRYDCYLDSARRGDDYLRRLWETLQSMPEYAGKTSLLITTDHGRGQTKQDWTDHGKDVDGAEFVWIGAMGPGVEPLGVRENVEATQSQIAATVAAMVGEDLRRENPRVAPPLPTAGTRTER